VGALLALTGAGYLTYLYPPLEHALSAELSVTVNACSGSRG
jgi:hypothetical protein